MADNKTSYPNKLRFDLGPKEIKELSEEIQARSKKALDHIVSIPAKERTFANTVQALSFVDSDSSADASCVFFPGYVAVSKEVRDAATEAQRALESFNINEVEMREDLYKALLDYKQNNPEEVSRLGPEEKRLLNINIRDFERNGLALPLEKRQRIKEIKQRLSELGITFNKNLNEDITKLLFSKEELDGMPEDYFANLKQEDGKYWVSLKYPELIPLMEKCKVESTRKKMDFLNSTKCLQSNLSLFEETLQLRQEEAKILGFENHAHLVLDIKMAKNSNAVFKFLRELTEKLENPAKKDIEKLLQIKKDEKAERGEPFDGKLNVWDWRYYETVLLEKEFQLDHEIIKEYFPLEKVTNGNLGCLSRNSGTQICGTFKRQTTCVA